MQLTDEILTMSRVKSGERERKEINLHKYVDQQLKLVESNISSMNLHVENNIPADVNEEVIENDLFQIVKNLITNAISYNRKGGKIKIDYGSHHDRWKLVVSDTGIGIPLGQTDRVFERFYRVNNATKGGTGLGLAIVKEAVDDMNGSVRIESDEDSGTTVIVKFKRDIN